jgi:putative transposase
VRGTYSIILQRAREKFPAATPQIISDNGPQFIARDFTEFIRLCGMTHVRTSPFYPQSNAHCERRVGSLRRECLDILIPLNEKHLRRTLKLWVDH